MKPPRMIVSDYERSSWDRMAKDAKAKGRLEWRIYEYASKATDLNVRWHGEMVSYYCAWLMFGWSEVDAIVATRRHRNLLRKLYASL